MDISTITISLKHASSRSGSTLSSPAEHHRWFSTIPPERRGLHGEFDYNGLTKRVYRCLNSNVDVAPGRLKVRQRGRVVVLSGHLMSPNLLHKVVDLALSVEGVDDVETHGVAIPQTYEAC